MAHTSAHLEFTFALVARRDALCAETGTRGPRNNTENGPRLLHENDGTGRGDDQLVRSAEVVSSEQGENAWTAWTPRSSIWSKHPPPFPTSTGTTGRGVALRLRPSKSAREMYGRWTLHLSHAPTVEQAFVSLPLTRAPGAARGVKQSLKQLAQPRYSHLTPISHHEITYHSGECVKQSHGNLGVSKDKKRTVTEKIIIKIKLKKCKKLWKFAF